MRSTRHWMGLPLAGIAAILLQAAQVFAQAEPAAAPAPAANESPETTPVAEPDKAPVATPAPAPAESATPANPEPVATLPVKESPVAAPRDDSAVLSEITVTAQKSEQSVKDVPISMSVIDSKLIAEKGITDVREAMQFVPNVKVESAGFFAAPRARGFSFNNNNKAIEPPLGIAIDGIPYTTPVYFNSAVFDLKRIEVLRGPQGTTFGKNTTAGLIHLITNDPTSEWNGVVDLQGGEIGRKRVELAGGGPLLDDALEFRVAYLNNKHDGFIRNTVNQIDPAAPELFRGTSHEGYRAKLLFPDLLGSSFKFAYEHVALEQLGAGEALEQTTQGFRDVVRKYDPNADFIEGNYIASIDGPDGRAATVDTMNLEWNSEFGDWNMTGLAGYSVLDTTLAVDADFTPVPALHGTGADKDPTTTFELRGQTTGLDGLLGLKNIFGLDLGSTDVVAGVFYQKRDILDSLFRFKFFDGPFLELTAAAGGDLAVLPPDASTEQFSQFFEQRGDVKAVFGQTQWHFLPQWTLQTGLRFSREKKDAVWRQVFDSPPPNVLMKAVGLEEFQATRSLTEDHLQPKISLQFDPIDEVSLFVHFARAFKGGGYNAFAFSGTPNELVYKPESLDEWGADIKTAALFGGKLRLNFSVFRMDAYDFQVLARVRKPGTIGLGITKVENAPHARAQGAEGDIMWLPFKGMTLVATLGYNDTKYLEFKTNECPANSTADPKGGDANNQCDATGKSFPFAPKWDTTLTASWTTPLFWGMNFSLGSTLEYESSQLLDLDLEEKKRQGAFTRLKGNIGIGHLAQGWSFQIIGNNLTNTVTDVRKGDVFANQILGVQDPPREFFGQLRYTF